MLKNQALLLYLLFFLGIQTYSFKIQYSPVATSPVIQEFYSSNKTVLSPDSVPSQEFNMKWG